METQTGRPRRRLTPKQEKFARALAFGEAKNQSEAYKMAYDVETNNKITIARQASKLANRPDIATRVERLRTTMRAPTLEEHLADLDEVRAIAIEEKQLSAATKATEMQGRAAGLYVERSISEHVHRMAEDDIKRPILEAIRDDAELRQAVIEALGITQMLPKPDSGEADER